MFWTQLTLIWHNASVTSVMQENLLFHVSWCYIYHYSVLHDWHSDDVLNRQLEVCTHSAVNDAQKEHQKEGAPYWQWIAQCRLSADRTGRTLNRVKIQEKAPLLVHGADQVRCIPLNVRNKVMNGLRLACQVRCIQLHMRKTVMDGLRVRAAATNNGHPRSNGGRASFDERLLWSRDWCGACSWGGDQVPCIDDKMMTVWFSVFRQI